VLLCQLIIAPQRVALALLQTIAQMGLSKLTLHARLLIKSAAFLIYLVLSMGVRVLYPKTAPRMTIPTPPVLLGIRAAFLGQRVLKLVETAPVRMTVKVLVRCIRTLPVQGREMFVVCSTLPAQREVAIVARQGIV